MNMIRLLVLVSLLFGTTPTWAHDQLPPPLVTGLKYPESVAVGHGGRIFISEMGERGQEGDGRILVVDENKAVPFATGLDDPRGIVFWNKWLFVTDNQRIWRIDEKGKAEVF